MTNIKIALTNLGKYNEGKLEYEWITLPATDDEIQAAFQAIEVAPNTRYEEWFISDYEAPFSINEYTSLDKLNELAKVLEEVDVPQVNRFGLYDVEDVLNYAYQLEDAGLMTDAGYYVGDVIDDEMLTEYVQQMVASGEDWTRIKFFLLHANNTASYHIIDGYGNVGEITSGHLESIVSDLTSELLNEFGL